MPGPYTTITVDEYNRLAATLQTLRTRCQKARQLLEAGQAAEALELLKVESDAG